MTAVSAAETGRAFTFADLDDAPDDGRRWELIDGSLVVSPAPFLRHQVAVREIVAILQAARTSDTIVVPSPYDWRVAATTESFQPDAVVIRRSDSDLDGPLRATPLLIVEVLSGDDARDRVFKRARYEALGVSAYWLVDTTDPVTITELRLESGRYVERATVSGRAKFATDWPYAVRLTPAALIEP
jgi:Uma2 family endonuclease